MANGLPSSQVVQVNTGGGHFISAPLSAGGDIVFGDQVKHHEQITQVITIPLPDAAGRYQLFLKTLTNPFLPDRPFTILEAPLFAGRDLDSGRVIQQVGDPRLGATAIYGAAGVGKTSLLTAGIIPQLKDNGLLVIYQADYTLPLTALRRALEDIAGTLGLEGGTDRPLAELVQAIVAATQRGLVLILDQFERYYLSPDTSGEVERQGFQRELGQAAALTLQAKLHILVSIRDDLRNRLFEEWGGLLPGLTAHPIDLGPLSLEQAFQSFHRSLAQVRNTGYDEDFVRRRLLGDLDRLDGLENSTIQPADLEIVGYELYAAARSQEIPSINRKLYDLTGKQKGVEFIIDRHFETLMDLVSPQNRLEARQVAFRMSEQFPHQIWFTPAELAPSAAGAAVTTRVLEEMAQKGLLIWQPAPGGRAYCFAGNTIARAAERSLGPEAHARRQARRDLDFVWRAWVNEDVLPNRGMLYFFEKRLPRGSLAPEHALLLLRAAAMHGVPVMPWLEQARSPQVSGVVRRMEESHDSAGQEGEPPGGGVSPGEETAWNHVRRLLGISSAALPPAPASTAFGPVAWSAAASQGAPGVPVEEGQPGAPTEGEDRSIHPGAGEGGAAQPARQRRRERERHALAGRETAVLALLAACPPVPSPLLESPPPPAIPAQPAAREEETAGSPRKQASGFPVQQRLEAAADAAGAGPPRRAELLGMLLEADPGAADLSQRPLRQRLGVWWWRFRRRFGRGLSRHLALSLGGAMGAGLGLGLLRALLAWLIGDEPGFNFYVYFPNGFLLGGLLAFFMLLTGPLCLPLAPTRGAAPTVSGRPFLPARAPALALGAFGFLLGNILLNNILRWDLRLLNPLLYLMMMLAGGGLGLAAWDHPAGGTRPAGLGSWLRVLVTAAVFAGVQAFFVFTRAYGSGLVFAWSPAFYEGALDDLLRPYGIGAAFYQGLSILDSALVGAVMAVGLGLGLYLAGRWHARWESLSHQARE